MGTFLQFSSPFMVHLSTEPPVIVAANAGLMFAA